MPLINCKIHLALSWSKDCIMSTIADTAFKIKSTKLYVPVVTLSTKHNVNLKYSKDLSIGKTATILQDFLLMLLFKEFIDSLFLLLTIVIMVLIKFKETVIQSVFFQE